MLGFVDLQFLVNSILIPLRSFDIPSMVSKTSQTTEQIQ